VIIGGYLMSMIQGLLPPTLTPFQELGFALVFDAGIGTMTVLRQDDEQTGIPLPD
jgi:hypothetical protein